MNVVYDDDWVKQYCGDCLDVLPQLEAESVQCCPTSPPYWGLRMYEGAQDRVWGDNHCEHEWEKEPTIKRGHPGNKSTLVGTQTTQLSKGANYHGDTCQLCGAWRGSYGHEPTPEMYVEHTVEILRQIRRVLRKDGVVFWNIGDSYNSKEPSNGRSFRRDRASVLSGVSRGVHANGLKPKDLCLIPFRVALAAQADGWWVRSVIIWNKPNPMPESCKDRPTESHEYILLLAKSARYYWDMEAVRENVTGSAHARGDGVNPKARLPQPVGWDSGSGSHNKPIGRYPRSRQNESFSAAVNELVSSRNIRSVWNFPTQPYKPSHYATFPAELPKRCIMAATSEKGDCSKCGKPWVRAMKKGLTAHDGNTESAYETGTSANRLALLRQAARERGEEYMNESQTIGWQPQCLCYRAHSIDSFLPPIMYGATPSLVLDPLSGTGTVGEVAKSLGRKAILIDTSEAYCKLAMERCQQVPYPMVMALTGEK